MRHPSYYDKQRAVALVGRELERRGWTLYGWKPDRSDSQTDYFDPESWDGIAERAGFVVAVDVSPYDVTSKSGGPALVRYVPGDPCPRCHGRRADPSGWTLARAQADPPAYHRDRTAGTGAVSLFPDVLSPLHFLGHGTGEEHAGDLHGLERCRDCGGRGHRLRAEHYREPWPTFQANPPRCTWHLEHAGQILARGTGVFAVLGDPPALARLVDRIEAATPTTEAAVNARLEALAGAIQGLKTPAE